MTGVFAAKAISEGPVSRLKVAEEEGDVLVAEFTMCVSAILRCVAAVEVGWLESGGFGVFDEDVVEIIFGMDR